MTSLAKTFVFFVVRRDDEIDKILLVRASKKDERWMLPGGALCGNRLNIEAFAYRTLERFFESVSVLSIKELCKSDCPIDYKEDRCTFEIHECKLIGIPHDHVQSQMCYMDPRAIPCHIVPPGLSYVIHAISECAQPTESRRT